MAAKKKSVAKKKKKKTLPPFASWAVKSVTSSKTEDELEKRVGETLTFFMGVYIYSGKLVRVTAEHAVIVNAGIVYETGELTSKSWSDRQALPPGEFLVSRRNIEICGHMK